VLVRTALAIAAVLVLAGCGEPAASGPDPSAPPAEQEYDAMATSLYADVVGNQLRVASDWDGLCMPAITAVYEGDHDSLSVFLEDDVGTGCKGRGAAACFDLPDELTDRRFVSVWVTVPQTAHPELPLRRGSKARAHGPQCP
jgi:hypothetical protein